MRRLVVVFVSLLFSLSAFAGQPESEDAVTNILFDENMENAYYAFRSDGFVDIWFGPAVSDKDYSRILERLRTHPDIPGVLAGRGTKNYCAVP
ncbi:MAG: hypothetical protein ACYCZA_09560 [Thiobacillus sp.]